MRPQSGHFNSVAVSHQASIDGVIAILAGKRGNSAHVARLEQTLVLSGGCDLLGESKGRLDDSLTRRESSAASKDGAVLLLICEAEVLWKG